MLYDLLGVEGFKVLFPVLLTDNGSEFSNPKALEFDAQDSPKNPYILLRPSRVIPKAERGIEP